MICWTWSVNSNLHSAICARMPNSDHFSLVNSRKMSINADNAKCSLEWLIWWFWIGKNVEFGCSRRFHLMVYPTCWFVKFSQASSVKMPNSYAALISVSRTAQWASIDTDFLSHSRKARKVLMQKNKITSNNWWFIYFEICMLINVFLLFQSSE